MPKIHFQNFIFNLIIKKKSYKKKIYIYIYIYSFHNFDLPNLNYFIYLFIYF